MNIYAGIARFISLYSTLIWIRIMLTWLPSQRYYNGAGDGPIVSILKAICDPFLNLFRSSKARAGNIDFSPLLALMCLNILQSVFRILAQSGVITVPLVLILVINGFWQYFFSIILVLLCVALIVRYICGRKTYNPRCVNFLTVIDPLIKRPVNFVARLIYPRKVVSDQQYVLTAFIFYLLVYIGIKQGLVYLITWLSTPK